jgi:hypothetical protein
MLRLTNFFAGSSFRICLGAVAVAGAAMLLAACQTTARFDDPPQVLGYQYRSESGVAFVRIEQIEAGAADNAHPFSTSVAALRPVLANIKVKGASSSGAVPVFTNEELDEIVPHLVAALARAGPKEDVTFAAAGEHGLFGKYSRQSYTTGRLFVRDGQANILFGRVHERYAPDDQGLMLVPGSRTRRVETGWDIVPENARVADKRSDWVTLETKTAPAATTPPAPAVDSRYREIDNRLKLLEQLKSDGRITEEEYRERRRAILQGI